MAKLVLRWVEADAKQVKIPKKYRDILSGSDMTQNVGWIPNHQKTIASLKSSQNHPKLFNISNHPMFLKSHRVYPWDFRRPQVVPSLVAQTSGVQPLLSVSSRLIPLDSSRSTTSEWPGGQNLGEMWGKSGEKCWKNVGEMWGKCYFSHISHVFWRRWYDCRFMKTKWRLVEGDKNWPMSRLKPKEVAWRRMK